MAHPGRPKGRTNKRTQQTQSQSQSHSHSHTPAPAHVQAQLQAQQQAQAQAQAHARAQQQAQQQAQHTRMKEEPGVQLHDDADLISFRTDALNRFITNQEYMENVTSKLVHTSKIIPPGLFQTLNATSSEDYDKLNPEDIYFGDSGFMKYKERKLLEELERLKSEDDPQFVKYIPNSPEYIYQREQTDKLNDIQSRLNDKESLQELESELNKTLLEYQQKFHRKYDLTPNIKKYSVEIKKISSQEVDSAPENYNPKSINTFINMPNAGNAQMSMNGQIQGHPNMHQHMNANAPNHFNGGFMNQFDQGPAMNFNANGQDFNMSMVKNGNHDGTGPLKAHPNPQNMNIPQPNMHAVNHDARNPIDDDMNDLFKGDDQELDQGQAMVEDDMGDLINFDGNDDMMGGSAFDQDFLSQIDHSME
ncbi:uncharacterized protein CANTADRAFT_89416 [Suhomyces tanzawaensis NRRL Y-17324]|uniref:Uncharacterized protein n=1 Tax=Suhomyces tanzawaensis NRRL Y-17324 TaxID=984487 RepID=A0A1E4SK27_9ASCO|nr:uncharacterized protein CANTADRAFT_89416 [Suhomyces tanzawaensis NRRL Y-17324]ODV79787.1 hypothetical protein CANTADRAFT_89416 [Suhomyces tanzawaensis NRRL Y-17324]